MGEQVGDDLGIGFRGEAVALGLEFLAQLGMVFDDAVVHHRHLLAAHVRVGVALGRHAVGGPAGMGDAQVAVDGGFFHQLPQHGHLAHRADAADMAVGLAHRQARRVIAAIFQALQALDQDGNDVALGDGADDATHG
jgi:hypothetical protein